MWKESYQFLREVRTEMKKVSWPTRKDTVNSTSMVLITVIIIAIFLGLIDLGLSKVIQQLLKIGRIG
jgi:preprotein translocase subunit SecE